MNWQKLIVNSWLCSVLSADGKSGTLQWILRLYQWMACQATIFPHYLAPASIPPLSICQPRSLARRSSQPLWRWLNHIYSISLPKEQEMVVQIHRMAPWYNCRHGGVIVALIQTSNNKEMPRISKQKQKINEILLCRTTSHTEEEEKEVCCHPHHQSSVLAPVAAAPQISVSYVRPKPKGMIEWLVAGRCSRAWVGDSSPGISTSYCETTIRGNDEDDG